MSENSELHAAILNTEPLSVVQRTHDDNPSKLTKDILLDACEYGDRGVLRFLANNFLCQEDASWDEIVKEASERFFCSGLSKPGTVACPLQDLSVQFEECQSQRVRLAMLELIGYLPNLKRLVLFDVVDPEGLFCESLSRLAQRVPLQELRVAFDHDNSPSEESIRELLDAIQKSKRMKQLWLFMGQSSSQTKSICLSRLVDILQHYDSPLERVVLDFPGEYNKEQLKLKKQLRYEAALNKSGRAEVRAPSATVSDLVRVLSSAAGSKGSPVSVESVLFGLLQETPALWSFASRNLETQEARGRKRTASLTCHELKGSKPKTLRLPLSP